MLGEPNRKKRTRQLLVTVGLLLLGGALGARAARLTVESDGVRFAPPTLVLALVGLPFITLAMILIHEVGHALGGLVNGFRFVMLTVGPFRLAREGQVLRLGLNRSINVGGGLTVFLPTDSRHLLPSILVYVLGGPLASLAAGFFLLALSFRFPVQPPGTPLEFLPFFSFIGALLGLLMGVLTLVPMHAGGFPSDGAQMLDLLRGGHSAERRLLSLAITAQSVSGIRPRDWNGQQVQRLLSLEQDERHTLGGVAVLLGFYHYWDRAEFDRAGQLLDRAVAVIDQYPQALRASLLLEIAFWEAWYRRRPLVAHQRLAQSTSGLVEFHTQTRVQAALLWAEGEERAALRLAKAGLAQVTSAMDLGGAIVEREWFESLLTAGEEEDNHGGETVALDDGRA